MKLEELQPEQAEKTREEFLRGFGKTEMKKRKDLKDAFVANPLAPIKELLEKVEKERAQQIVVAFKASPDLVDRIDNHKQIKDDWTRSDAVKDLVERGIRALAAETA